MRVTTYSSEASAGSKPVRGFTLIEILIVIGMLAILATIVLVAVNPLRQFAQARNTQREANVVTILNAVSNRIADNRGIFAPAESDCALPAVATQIQSGGYDLRPCIVPDYVSEIPYDPSIGENSCTSQTCVGEAYETGYTIEQPASSSRVTVCAPEAEEDALPGSEPFCLTR